MLDLLFPQGLGWKEILVSFLDIALIAFLIYQLLAFARGTRGIYIIQGLLIFLLALYICNLLGLETVSWFLERFTMLLPVALVILFYPELRALMEEIGKIGLWGVPGRFFFGSSGSRLAPLEEVVRAVGSLSARRMGALIVLEKGAKVEDYILQGTPLDAKLSSRLLESVFYPGNPLHDGAVLIRGDRIVQANCILPLSTRHELAEHLHTRHRAALGLSELTDAVVIVISEETGSVSLAYQGELFTNLSQDSLRRTLHSIFLPKGDKDVEQDRA